MSVTAAARPGRWTRWRRTGIAVACAAIAVAAMAVIAGSAREGSQRTLVAPATDVAHSSQADGDTAFPEFTLAGADGMSITKTSLAGTKSLIWFTRSTCPDSEGMHGVAGLDDELGGEAFTIVVVLVDLHEPAPWLDEWRDGFGRPDWKVAPEEPAGLWAKLGEPGLESKFLLDEQSTVIDTTTRLVDADYLATLREYLA